MFTVESQALRYRIRRRVDGTLMITHTAMAWGAVMMRPVIVDPTSGDAALAVDWIRMTPYAGRREIAGDSRRHGAIQALGTEIGIGN